MMSDNAVITPPAMDVREILKRLPHRFPFLLVDRVLELDLEKDRIVAQKNVTFNESFFQGHFPDKPMMPGVLILEALAQAGGILFHNREGPEKIAVLLNVKNAKFRNPVYPGDVLILRCEAAHVSAKGGRVKAEALVDDKLVCQAEITFGRVNKE